MLKAMKNLKKRRTWKISLVFPLMGLASTMMMNLVRSFLKTIDLLGGFLVRSGLSHCG